MDFQINKPWINPSIKNPKLIFSHQDQVIKLPKIAEILSGNEFCPISSFCVGDKIFTLQGHPEFENTFALKLLHLRKARIGLEKFIDAKNKLLDDRHDGKIVGRWIVNFLNKTFY